MAQKILYLVKPQAGTLSDTLVAGFFRLCGLLSIAVLLGIFLLLISNSIQFFSEVSPTEIFGTIWRPSGYEGESYGILSLIVGTLFVVGIAMTIAIPFGILSAIYLAYLAPTWLAEILKPIVEFIAAIPSVVVGFLGIALIGPIISDVTGAADGLNALNGGILLAIMSLPTIVSIAEDSLRSVPRSLVESSYALGANKWKTIWRICVPSALSGIIAAIMLGLGRAIGETMTVLMVTGNSLAMPSSILDSVQTLTATIAMEMGEVSQNTSHYYGLFMLGLILFLLTFAVNMIADLLIKERRRETA